MPKKGGPKLTELIRNLSDEMSDHIDDDGNPLTRAEALALLLWKMSLGYEEVVKDPDGAVRDVKHPPAAWAINLVYDRMEGKVPVSIEDVGAGRLTVAEKVSEVAKSRINTLAAVATDGKKPLPPKVTRPKDGDE